MTSTLVNNEFLGEKIEDVDEELFILYTRRAGFKHEIGDALDSIVLSESSNRSALGLVDQRNDSVDLQFSYNVEDEPKEVSKKRRPNRETPTKTRKLDITLAQNITALRSRAGDTGGGVWRGSILLAQALLQQLHSTESFFNKETLKSARVLELGSGTGLLGLVLAPFASHHTCTDLPDLIPLIRKNISINSNILSHCPGKLSHEALDWNDVHNCSPAARERMFLKNLPIGRPSGGNNESQIPGFDLVLAVDCVYNPSLIPPLLTTIDLYAIPGRTVVLVVMELRDEDVVREFLTQWTSIPHWEIKSVGNDIHASLLDERFAIWMGLKSVASS